MEIVKSELKRKQGRPPVYDEPMVRGSFRVPADTVASLLEIGGGNITRAIIRLVEQWEANGRVIRTAPYATIHPDCEAPSFTS